MVSAIIKYATDPSKNIFDGLVTLMQTNWSASPTSMVELRQAQKTKAKGDLFEHFALLYFKHCFIYKKKRPSNVWLLSDLPDDLAQKLGLKGRDVGIDLIVELEPGEYAAVQAKYRKPNAYKPNAGITWKDLSTFYALVDRSGPYVRHIVFTNAHYASHKGHKQAKDLSICIKTLQKITIAEWHEMAQMQGNVASTTTLSVPIMPVVSEPEIPEVPLLVSSEPAPALLSEVSGEPVLKKILPKIRPKIILKNDPEFLRKKRSDFLDRLSIEHIRN
jgi:hypothetical protein